MGMLVQVELCLDEFCNAWQRGWENTEGRYQTLLEYVASGARHSLCALFPGSGNTHQQEQICSS